MNGTSWVAKILRAFLFSPRKTFRAAVLLAFVLGSSGQAAIVRAAAAGEDYRFTLNVVAPRTTLCTGQTVTYKADVYGEKAPITGSFVIKVAGVKVDAYPADKSIGAFIGADKKGFVSRRMGSDLLDPSSVVFKFKAANKPGTSKLFFEGAVAGFDINTGYISFTVPVRVIACKYRITTITKFLPNAAYNPMIKSPPITIKMVRALVTADQIGHFNGSGTLHWYGTTYVTRSSLGIATASEKFNSTSQVSINGEVFEDGQLVLNLTYDDAVSSSISVTVDGVRQGQPALPYKMDPLKVSVPAAGGSVTLPQSYNSSTYMGKTYVIVTLVKDK